MDFNELFGQFKATLQGLAAAGSSSTLLGLDIGISAVKVIAVEKHRNSWKVVDYAFEPLPELALIDDDIQKPDEIMEALKACIKKISVKSDSVSIGLFGKNTLARKIQLVGGDGDDLEDQIMWEAEQYIPFEVDESEISYHVMGENEGGGFDTLIAAATHEVIGNYKKLVESCGLKVKVVDLGVLALTNVFSYVFEKELEQKTGHSWLVFEFGAQKTTMVVYREDRFVFSKEMPIGGVMITEEIQRQMGVNYYEAEDLKINGTDGNLPEEIMVIIKEVLDQFYAEVRKALDFYLSTSQDDSIEDCILTGGAVLTPGLIEGMEELLGLKVKILNPFDVFEYSSENLDDDDIREISFRGTVALGLAMRNVND